MDQAIEQPTKTDKPEKAPWYERIGFVSKFIEKSKGWKVPLTGGVSLYHVGLLFLNEVQKSDLTLNAASITYNVFLAIFPTFIFFFTLVPFFPIEGATDEIMYAIRTLMPTNAFLSITDTLQDILDNQRGGLLTVGFISALYFASNGVSTILTVFNKFSKDAFWRKKLLAVGLTLGIGLVVIIAVALIILSSGGLNWVLKFFHVYKYISTSTLRIFKWSIMIFTIFVIVMTLFYFGARKRTGLRHILPGAILATVLIILVSVGYGYYVNNFGNYNKAYGSLGALVITLLWLNYNATVLIIGHEFNQSIAYAKLFEEKAEEKGTEAAVQVVKETIKKEAKLETKV